MTNEIHSNLSFPTKKLRDEYKQLPTSIIAFVNGLQDRSEFRWVVTSIKSDYSGNDRTPANGPNHYEGIAIDIVPDFHFEKIHDRDDRVPNYNRLPLLMKCTYLVYISLGSPNIRVVLEADHLHIDTNLSTNNPGVYYYTKNKAYELRSSSICQFSRLEIKSVIPVLRLMNLT